MPETKAEALKRASKEGYSENLVVKATKGNKSWYIAPHGLKSAKSKRAYADCRAQGGSKSECAAVSWNIEKGK